MKNISLEEICKSLDCTKEELCRWYANAQGEKYGFSDKDFAWQDEYEYAINKKEEDLAYWAYENF